MSIQNARKQFYLGASTQLCALFLSSAILVYPQTNVGRISGSVTDSSGAPVPDCPVTATAAQGRKEMALTDGAGMFRLPGLAAGIYDLSVEKQGFRTEVQSGLVLDASSERIINFRLEVGQLSETVNISASSQQVQTTSGNVGNVINDQQVSQIALNGREYTQLLRLSPGVVATTLNVFNPQLALNQQRINGIRTDSSYFLLDGAENHDNGANTNGIIDPNVDAIAEVKMETSSYAAEFGGRAGAVINVVTKSGTKDFHGTLFEFVRNDAFDARSFFSLKVDSLRFNDFGGTIGGPLYIPGRFNRTREKLFFLFSEEFKYTRQGQTTTNTVPNAAERTGDFRASTLPAPVDPATGAPFANRLVPSARWSKNGPLLLKPYPLPNFVDPAATMLRREQQSPITGRSCFDWITTSRPAHS